MCKRKKLKGKKKRNNEKRDGKSQKLSKKWQTAKGGKITDETRKKLSIATSGKNNPMYGKRPWNKGIPMTEEQKKALHDGRDKYNAKKEKE